MKKVLYALLLSLFITSCGKKETSATGEVYCNTDEYVSSWVEYNGAKGTIYVDSVTSPDGNLKIYGWGAMTDASMRGDEGSLIVYRSADGEQHIEKRSIMEISTKGENHVCLPALNIYQGKREGKDAYIIEMECFGGTTHNNTVIACMHIEGDSLKPFRVFATGTRPTNIVSNDEDASDDWWHSFNGIDYNK